MCLIANNMMLFVFMRNKMSMNIAKIIIALISMFPLYTFVIPYYFFIFEYHPFS
ncbi:hypothetical protein BPJM79_60059 [Bacillus pumilus]